MYLVLYLGVTVDIVNKYYWLYKNKYVFPFQKKKL